MKIWLKECFEAIGHSLDCSDYLISKVCTDSRDVEPDALFFALKGERVDGHDFLADVASRGACAAIVDASYQGNNYGLLLIRVPSVLESLQQLARHVLRKSKARVVAVTGSVGKTTTKGFIATLLSEAYQVACSPGNYNSQVGVPLTILNHLQEDDEILVQEMAMTEAGNLRKLIAIAPPEVAVITTICLVHACNFDSLYDIAMAKGEILEHPDTCVGILLRDNEHYGVLSQTGLCRKESYSVKEMGAEYFLDAQRALYERGERVSTLPKLPVPGKHHEQNALAALVVARYFGLEWEQIIEGFGKLTLSDRRFELVQKSDILFVNDSYNACAVSMKASLETLPLPRNGGKRIAVLGGMLELGKFSDICHREVGEAALKYVDRLLCFGSECGEMVSCWKEANRPVEWTCDRMELVKMLQSAMQPGDVVLIKGSCGKEMWKLLEEI